MMDGAIGRIRDMVDANTMVGAPITTPDGVTVIPVSRLSFGFASGGGNKEAKESSIWGGAGAAVKVDPVGFLIVRDSGIHMMSINPPAGTIGERVLDLAPEILEKIENCVEKYTAKKPSKPYG